VKACRLIASHFSLPIAKAYNFTKCYLAGGEGIDFSIEVMENEKWTMLQTVKNTGLKRLYLPGAAVLDGKLFCLGGWKNENDVVQTVRSVLWTVSALI